MTRKEQITRIIYDAIDEINLLQPSERKLVKSPETLLYGEGALLDSVGLVTLIVATEQRIDDEMGRAVFLASEKAMSRQNSPFRTIVTLTEYIASLLEPA